MSDRPPQPGRVPVRLDRRPESATPHPLLAAGAVHVWQADLATVTAPHEGILSSDELARAERFADPRRGLLWGRSRALLRELLGRYLQREPGDLRFATGAEGKPSLDQRPPPCFFNLSHSGTLALYAFSPTHPVGVDIELTRPRRHELAIAARSFGDAEALRLSGLARAERGREFLRLWVRHEARLKCIGIGIGIGADGAEEPRAGEHEPEPWVIELEAGVDAAAAVAVARPPSELRYIEWNGIRECS